MDLPPLTVELQLIGQLLRAMEAESPGFIQRMYEGMSCDVAIATAIRIRGPRMEPKVLATLDSAMAWMTMATVARDVEAGARRKAGKRKA